ncbi:uncharacterized protein LOC109016520 isoform X1 [Juglans regia]|uniref:Uncharacterized protein LOC109016520 isoform X1 n=1 Tax=Juglans regia TaxID=51240 RepID=A0A6P9E5C2_JUGRE|nr:uncharacterized protein LOC109016520 isoform X1 [Juglans regia]
MAVLAYLVLFLALTGHSSATYCMCKDGMNQQDLQKALDYACGAGADCTPILQSGACYQPNTVKNHCDWAVNSYFQKKGQAQGSCDFSGTATTSMTAPSKSPCARTKPPQPAILCLINFFLLILDPHFFFRVIHSCVFYLCFSFKFQPSRNKQYNDAINNSDNHNSNSKHKHDAHNHNSLDHHTHNPLDHHTHNSYDHRLHPSHGLRRRNQPHREWHHELQ